MVNPFSPHPTNNTFYPLTPNQSKPDFAQQSFFLPSIAPLSATSTPMPNCNFTNIIATKKEPQGLFS
ncbi:MAG: hypothetical protein IJ492_04055 [Clostridia bacterium]|nr:hypothetical protein [Clostridia bacterium]